MGIYEESESLVTFKVKTDEEKIETTLKTEFSVSSRLFCKLIKNKSLFLNGEHAHRKDKAKIGDILTIIIPHEEDTNV